MKKKDIVYVKKSKFNIILENEIVKVAPPLSALFSQYNLNCTEFCDKFNEHLSNDILFEKGLPLLVTVIIYKNKSYDFIIKGPSIGFLIDQAIQDENYAINLLDLYKIFLIRNFYIKQTYIEFLYTCFGTLRSFEVIVNWKND